MTNAEIGDIQITAVGFGPGAEEANLRDVAEKAGGVFLAEDNVSDVLSLQKFFVTAAGEIFDSPIASDPRGVMQFGQTETPLFPIEVCNLDERVYEEVPPISDFVQVEPTEGAPATEQTDIWLFFDDDNVYITGRCWDSAPESEWSVNEMRRDGFNIVQNDHFAVMFDTFYDRRSGFMFYANPLGGRSDYSVVDEASPNSDWNPVWDVAYLLAQDLHP